MPPTSDTFCAGFTNTHFYIVFKPTKSYLEMAKDVKVGEKGIEKRTKKITKNQKIILKKMLKDSKITILELSKTVGISNSKIKKNIAKLKQKGLLKRIGSNKGGYWEVCNL